MIHLIALFFAGVLGAQPLSVTACGADPTGKLDSTSAFQKCLARQPEGNLVIPIGTYLITSPIFKNRNQNLIGMGPNASILKCQSPQQPCIVAADTTGGGTNYSVSKIQDVGLEGPGSGTNSIGIQLGADPSGQLISANAFGDEVNIVDSRITGFQYGVQWGNNAWANKIVRTGIWGNSVALYIPPALNNSGEAISITDSDIFNNTTGIEDHANFEWMIQGTSFDYNSIAFTFFGATIHAVNCHIEQQSAQVFSQPYGAANLSLKDSEILIQAATGSDPYILNVWPQSLNLSIDNVSIWSNHTVQYFMRSRSNTTGTITNLYGNGNRMIGALTDGPTQAILSAINSF